MAKLKNAIRENIAENKVNELQSKMRQQVEDSEYVDAMDTMAELVQYNGVTVDIMYLGAYCYMMTGDNERSVKWINNVLALKPDHIKARILLGRVCSIENRTDDALAVFEFVLENMESKLEEEDRTELEDLLEYYRYSDSEMIQEKYPRIATFLGITKEEKKNTELDSKEDVTDPTERARNAVARLRELLRHAKNKEETTDVDENKVASELEAEGNVINDVISDDMSSCNEEFNVETITQQIMSNPVSIREKIKLFNAFAAARYVEGDYQSAFDLLNGALLLDSTDSIIIKNIAYVCAAAGEHQQALEFVSKIPMIEFGTLNDIGK